MYCRCKLSHGDRELRRGDMGIVVRAKPNVDRYLCKWDGDERCVDGCWLEPYPGTFSLGFNRILALTYPFYGLGPCVSDAQFPQPPEAASDRYLYHRKQLTTSGFGFAFHNYVLAENMLVSMSNTYRPEHCDVLQNSEKLGLIVCEHPWLRGPGDRMKFLAALAWSFLSQLSTTPKILITRVSDWEKIARQFNNVRRIQVLVGKENFRPHYKPLCHTWNVTERHEIHASECAIIFHPSTGVSSRFQFSCPLHVPECVLKEMFRGRRSFFLAAGTCESQMECLHYFLEKLRMYNIPPPCNIEQLR